MRSFLLAVALAATTVLTTQPGQANDRYRTRPPVLVSPDLSAPWVMQLRRSPGGEVNRRTVMRPAEAAPARRILRPAKRRELRRDHRREVKREQVRAAATVAVPKPKAVTPKMNPKYLPATVAYDGGEKTGTIIINTNERYLYLVLPGGKARRYGVGVGKPGFEWAGTHKVTQKREWPDWRPPAEMIARERKKGRVLPVHMAGGPANPLGARALYLGSTLYRIHGTNAPWTIGGAVSSGCIRMRNEDVIDLYERVPVGAKVVVI
ncbi:MAG: L,D-transpeptidase [Rhizobiaceae bacterium]